MTATPKYSIDLGKNGQFTFDSTLSNAQISKFKGLMQRLIIDNNTAYLRLDELHGVLLTNTRQQAIDILTAHNDLLKPYLVSDKVRFAKHGVMTVVKPVGVYVLLDHLATVRAARAVEYRASLVLLSYVMAKHPGVMLGDWNNAKEQFQKISKAMRQLKKQHSACQVTGHPFHSGDEKHVHHIEGKSENPSKADDTGNLVVIHGWVHDDYHSWAIDNGLPISKASFWFYASKRGYSSEFVRSLNSKAIG
jgi:Fe2+ or Zn2+ uptake regulation protein